MKRFYQLITFSLIALFPFPGYACDLYLTCKNQTSPLLISLDSLKNITNTGWRSALTQYQQQPFHTYPADAKPEYALLEVAIGDRYMGLQYFNDLLQQYPNDYSLHHIAAWAFTIAQQYEPALQAAQKAIAIHPSQNAGADSILIHTIRSAQGLIPATQILSLPTQSYYQFLTNSNIKLPLPSDSLIIQAGYILVNRIQLFSHNDSITAQLLLDMGDILAKNFMRNDAMGYYEYALQFDPSLQEKIDQRTQAITSGKETVKQTFRWAAFIWGLPIIAMIFFAAGFIKARKQRKNQSS